MARAAARLKRRARCLVWLNPLLGWKDYAPVARAMAEDALNAEANSPDASIRSTAQLVQGLAGVVLGPNDPDGAAPS